MGEMVPVQIWSQYKNKLLTVTKGHKNLVKEGSLLRTGDYDVVTDHLKKHLSRPPSFLLRY